MHDFFLPASKFPSIFYLKFNFLFAQNCQKTKDVMRLRLLLTYLQNGISEPWQRIPSVLALFAAESSLILLDPSHDHYTTLSKHLMHSSKVNMKVLSYEQSNLTYCECISSIVLQQLVLYFLFVV